jgi:hypothetical protein
MMGAMGGDPRMGDVTGGITIAARVLREALMEEFVRENRAITAALYDDDADEYSEEAQAANDRVRAIGDLLSHLGWAARDDEATIALRFGEHDWAAAAALRAVIEREHRVAVRWNSVNDREEAQAATARRAAAILALGMLMDACEREGRDIANPPSLRDLGFDPPLV